MDFEAALKLAQDPLTRRAITIDFETALKLAQDPLTSKDTLGSLAGRFHVVDCLIAKHPNCPSIDDLERWQSWVGNQAIVQAYAQRSDLPPKILRMLAFRGDRVARERLLMNPNTTEKTRILIRNKFAQELIAFERDHASLLEAKQAIFDAVGAYRQRWGQYEKLLEELEAFANYHPMCWQPIYETITTAGSDYRRGNLVFAHLFTSADYPWPHLNGRPLAPLLQLDLRSIRDKSKQSGQHSALPDLDVLLQVWTTPTRERVSSVIRLVPGEHARATEPTVEAPTLSDEDCYLAMPSSGFGSQQGFGCRIVDWVKQAPKYIHFPWFKNEPEWDDRIPTGLQEAERCQELMHLIHKSRRSREDSKRKAFLWEAAYAAADQKLALCDSEVIANNDAHELIGTVRSLADPVSSTGGTHLFGTSAEFQMSNAWSELPRQTLFQFDGDGNPDFRISGYGTAIVSWAGDKFSYTWSPYG